MTPAIFYEHLFADPQRAGAHHLPHGSTTELFNGASAAECRVVEVDLGAVHDREALFDALNDSLGFPAWFGRNWDALADCLQDLAWLPAKGYVVILRHCDALNGSAGDDFVALVDIMNETAEAWREDGVPFWCLIDMQADGIAWLPSLPQSAA